MPDYSSSGHEPSVRPATGGSIAVPDRYDWADDPTAQDVIDALRMALVAQKDPVEAMKIIECLIDVAPETVSSRGIDLLLRLISEATLKVQMVEHD